MRYGVYFREMVIRKYFDESDWHPVHGTDYYRPLDLSVREFYSKSNVDGYDWYKWKEMREDLLSVEEMVEALVEWGYRFINENGVTDFVERPSFELIKYPEPITRISKNLIRSEMDSHPVLNGMLYDGEIVERNATQAVSLINQGERVRDAIRECHSSYPSIRRYGYKGTDRQMPRRTMKKVEECIMRLETGEKLKRILKELKLGAWSFYRYKHYF